MFGHSQQTETQFLLLYLHPFYKNDELLKRYLYAIITFLSKYWKLGKHIMKFSIPQTLY